MYGLYISKFDRPFGNFIPRHAIPGSAEVALEQVSPLKPEGSLSLVPGFKRFEIRLNRFTLHACGRGHGKVPRRA